MDALTARQCIYISDEIKFYKNINFYGNLGLGVGKVQRIGL